MEYKFFGNNTKSVKPISEEYSFIKDQRHLYELLFNIWNIDTCAPRLRISYSKENRTLGQCSITSFLVQDIFGGEVYGVPLENGSIHCFNKIDDVIFDLTSEQFGDTTLTYTLKYPQSRETHFLDKEKENRYRLLKEELLKRINKII